MKVAIIGGGLTGVTVAHELDRLGVDSVVYEREANLGGLVRSDMMEGVLYEPHGSHIFHTEDEEVWALVNELTDFRPYRHRVDIVIEGQILNWPIIVSDLDRQSRGDEIRAELEARRGVDPSERASASNFEEWCIDLMGPILYERYIRPYTEKQWGRPARELSAAWAPRRVQVRWDDDPYLFPDPFQGWPGGGRGYTDVIEGLASVPRMRRRLGCDVRLGDLDGLAQADGTDAVVVTCALDEFCNETLGPLEWRGILVRPVYVPYRDLAQSAMVVNYPGTEYPFIRVHETKHASGQECVGTVLGFEFTGAPSRYYPVNTAENEALNHRYQDYIREATAQRIFFAGRLANYVYIDMDDCIRQALDCARAVVKTFGFSS